MDELEKLIGENRQIFDSAEPSEGHFDKFEKMLMATQVNKSRSLVWPTLLKIASIVILLLLSGLYVTEHFILNNLPVANNKSSEFTEAQQYYIQLVDQRIGTIEQMKSIMTPEQKDMLVKELSEMDDMYEKLQKDSKLMPNDPRIIQAMLQHYQMKMDILNRIVNDLKNVQHLNSINHENIEL
jgi:hypothetical protein